ncbi:hypothetical protein THAOC_12480 [Thalassiosira oceanica]|uniref:Uncharacterized protein n=1 Tax=Thalassiosira oceanica TaxID=159749 RepID=K0SJY4_THAOC|nr:hypothetical protein THAOC_12480 [Thalassiosira oceanica]|eukprot:EJK66593.1 hypothetical protein THAOC_12480 [Thalassiosira oceanica]
MLSHEWSEYKTPLKEILLAVKKWAPGPIRALPLVRGASSKGGSIALQLWLEGQKDHVRPRKRPEARRGFEARSRGSGSKRGISWWGPIGVQADVAQPLEDEWRPRTSGDQGKDHVRPRKRPKLEEACKPSPLAVAGNRWCEAKGRDQEQG